MMFFCEIYNFFKKFYENKMKLESFVVYNYLNVLNTLDIFLTFKVKVRW